MRELVRHRAKLVALRSRLKAQVHGVLAKQGLLPTVSGVAGLAWLATAPLDPAYRARVDSLLTLIAAYDTEVDSFRRAIAARLAGHQGYGAIQQTTGWADVRRGVRRRDR